MHLQEFLKTSISNNLDSTQDDFLWEEAEERKREETDSEDEDLDWDTAKRGVALFKGIEFCTKFGDLNWVGGRTIQGTHNTRGPVVVKM